VSLDGRYPTFQEISPPSSPKSKQSWPLKNKPTWFFKTSGTTHQKTRRQIPEDLNLLDSWTRTPRRGGTGPLHRTAQTKLKLVTVLRWKRCLGKSCEIPGFRLSRTVGRVAETARRQVSYLSNVVCSSLTYISRSLSTEMFRHGHHISASLVP